MKRQTTLFIGFLLLLLTPAWAQEPAPLKLPDTPAARLLEAYVKAFNTGKGVALREFHAKHDMRPNREDGNSADGEDKMQGLISMLGTLQVQRVEEPAPREIRAFVKSNRGKWLAVWCQVKEDAPDKLSGFRLDRVPAPIDEKQK